MKAIELVMISRRSMLTSMIRLLFVAFDSFETTICLIKVDGLWGS